MNGDFDFMQDVDESSIASQGLDQTHVSVSKMALKNVILEMISKELNLDYNYVPDK